MNIFDQYGIKEVADVTLYSIHKKKDGSGDVYYVPALYLDTLKISSVEKTAENVWAEGGLGNARLICWDYGKQINVTLEDALCTPASLGMCWGGILSSDWKDGEIKHDYGISFNNKNPVERLSRTEKAFYPRNDREKATISFLLPQLKDDAKDIDEGILQHSSIIDGTKIDGFGYFQNHSYRWEMAIESDIKSIAVVPEKFFDIYGRSYPIAKKTAIGIRMPSQTDEFKMEVIYKINLEKDKDKNLPVANAIILEKVEENTVKEQLQDNIITLKTASYLKIRVDNNDNYTAYLGNENKIFNLDPTKEIATEQFKGIDMWIRFKSINEMIYFLITKYENDVWQIGCGEVVKGAEIGKEYEIDSLNTGEEVVKAEGRLWSYINPKTMEPYPDDYWFSQGEPYYIKSLTLAPKNKKLKSQKIVVTAGQFPGMYMMVGETYIRSRDTGEDERMQIKIPLCKVKSNQNITLEAEGEPTVFNMDIEVARPVNGIMMELTSYEVAEKMVVNENGIVETKDGSTEVLSE